MDIIFSLAHKEGVSPVSVSLRKDLLEAGSAEAQQNLENSRNGSVEIGKSKPR